MKRFVYKEIHLEYLKKSYPKMLIEDLAKAFNREFSTDKTPSAIRAACRNRKISAGRTGNYFPPPPLKVTGEQFQFIADCYSDYSMPGMTRAFNRVFNAEVRISQMGKFVRENELLLSKVKNAIRIRNFKNRNGRRFNSSHFKCGNRPAVEAPLGTERYRESAGYVLVKVEVPDQIIGTKTSWRPKHLLNWESQHGPVPSGKCLVFKDGDKLNSAIENLELISRKLMMKLNLSGYWSALPELRPTIRALAELDTKVSELAG